MADTNGRSSRPRRAPARSSRPASGRASSGGSSSAPASSRGSAGTSRRAAAGAAAGGAAARKRRFFDYPRSGYTGLHRWLPSWRFVIGAFLAGCFLLAGGVVAAYATVKVPKVGEDINAQTTKVYFAGSTADKPGPLMGKLPGVNREIVDYSTLPEYIGQAVAAGEDKTFFTNRGVDFKGMARAMFKNVTTGTRQGGSSLTQEYVERYYVGKTTTSYTGKVKETLLALKIGRTQSKDEILDRYLNTIYFGRGAYGIQAASQAYFGIDAKDLSVSQAALLAGIIPSPSYWDPAVSPDRAQARWGTILDSMESMGWISAADRAKQEFPETIAVKNNETFKGTNGYLLKMVTNELLKHGFTEDQLERGGYTIVTTIQKPAQKAAVATAKDVWDGTLGQGNKPNKNLRMSIVSIDPKDGGIVALYGGKDFLTDQRNSATYDNVQPGSTFKPFTLVAALQDGIGLGTRFNGRSPQTVPGWGSSPVTNYSHESYGTIDLVTATEHSVNTVYAQLNNKIGYDATAAAARTAGVDSSVPLVPSNVLGTAVVHPIEIADAYATFAAQGKHSSAFIVRKVLNHNGTTAYGVKPDTKQVFDKDVMADATYAMTQVVKHGTGETWIGSMDRPIAGKSGTTNETKAAWFVAYTPHIATAVALSQDGKDGKSQVSITPFEPSLLGGEVTGGTTPAHIWNEYMSQVFKLPQFAAKTEFPDRSEIGAQPTFTSRPTATTAPSEQPTQAPTTVTVPTGLVGRLEGDASALVYAAGLSPSISSAPSDTVGVGRVISVSPGEGSKVKSGAAVTLVISTGPKTPATQPPTQQPTSTPTPKPTSGAAGGNGNGTGGGGDTAGGAGPGGQPNPG
ncbi:transglycosylase domain-containing protein [Cellulomonas alba]|uniref:Transglycosylase domain-containing protein n=1 Tax=Cellulomonas alba TaxID=3053467 RepID=A0ABT7SFP1_9CELL|nr:transglycosylase domain-containing protein [Cellulomonas alba]MDM7855013.1 transglycosylase domain-containing protein [Cellulomonas alba]